MTPLLPLESFRRIMGLHPWHFWQLADNDKMPLRSACNGLVKQYSWQDADAAGRADIMDAIETAEARLFEYLGYRVAPQYIAATVPAVWPLILPEGHVQALGVQQLLDVATVTPTVTDRDTDGLEETFEATFATSVTDPHELTVWFTAADAPHPTRIEPVDISITGGTATIRGARWLLVKPALYEGSSSQPFTPTDPATFASALLVRRLTTDATQAGTLHWNDPSCCGGATSSLSLILADGHLGIVGRSHCCASYSCGCPPDQITVNYLAGAALEAGQMQRRWQVIVARLAAAELERGVCACKDGNRPIYHWQFDLARAQGAMEEQYQISPADLDGPFGTRRGQVYAWRQVRNLRQHRSVLA